jgi:sulfur carrier protein ThiS
MAIGCANETLRALLAEYGFTEEMLAEAVNERVQIVIHG